MLTLQRDNCLSRNHQLRTSNYKVQFRASFVLVTYLEELEEKHIKKARLSSKQIQLIYPFYNAEELMLIINQAYKIASFSWPI